MQELNIQITSTKITSFNVSYSDDSPIPIITVHISLLTAGGKNIASYSISSDHWEEDKKFEIPPRVLKHLPNMEILLEKIVSKHCQCSTMALI